MIEHIKVTAEHIASGKPLNPKCCPIALAMLDAGIVEPHVSRRMCAENMDQLHLARFAMLPPEAAHFREMFDGGFTVHPFEFDVDLR